MAKPIKTIVADAAKLGKSGRGGYMPRRQIAAIVDRLHVGKSNLFVARKVWRKVGKGFPRSIKRAAVRMAIQEHRRNQSLYRAVMTGRF